MIKVGPGVLAEYLAGGLLFDSGLLGLLGMRPILLTYESVEILAAVGLGTASISCSGIAAVSIVPAGSANAVNVACNTITAVTLSTDLSFDGQITSPIIGQVGVLEWQMQT